ncbi:MAG TPA: AAA family ATPase [Methylomirabilota bacterium]
MAQYEMNLRDYWLLIRRRRLVIGASTALVMALSWWFAQQKVPVYQATAAVKFEQSTSMSGLLLEVLSYNTADSIETQATLIKSYPILEEVARRMGRLPEGTKGQAVRESKAYTAILDDLGAKIRTTRVPSTSILEITATSTSPREARDLANTVAETYRDYNRTNRNARITEARKFIEGQLKDVEARVKRAEEEVWAFREAHRVISPGAESTVLVALFTQVRGDIEKARQQRTELEVMQARLARSPVGDIHERIYVDSQNPAMMRLQATQTELLLERNNLALEVTDQHPRLRAIDDRLREVRAEMRREIGAQINLLRNREEILERQMAELLQKNREVPAVELTLQRLQRDAKVNDDLLTVLKTKHQEALIKESEGVEEVTVVRPAADPPAPVGAETVNTVLVGGILGLFVGLVLAFIQETLDTSIGTIEDVETYLEVPVLGIIPHIDARETVQRLIERRPALAEVDDDALSSHALLITHFDPKSPVAEAYRTLRTKVQFECVERQGKILVVTSPTLQEGKTTTIVNLALTMAQNGQRTLLVGANLRRPSIHRFFGIEREPGLSDILVGNAQWRDCIRTVADILMGRFEMEDVMAAPGLDNLHIIEAGPIPANPSELLSTPAMGQFLRAVRDDYDIVLIDTPPVLPVTDSAVVAGQADGVVLVYQAGKVGRLVLKRAKIHLESARAKVWGVVLNDLQTEIAAYAYTHYYTHYYGEETRDDAPRGRIARAVDFVRARIGKKPAATTPDNGGEGDNGASKGRRRRKSRYKNVGMGVFLLGGMLATLGAATAWRMGLMAPDVRPRALVRHRLDTLPGRALPTRGDGAEPPLAAAAPPPSAATGASPTPDVDGAPVTTGTAPPPAAPPTTTARVAPAPLRKPSPVRFAIEFGPFLTAADSERVERQLTQAGYQTVRYRQEAGGTTHAVFVEDVATAADADNIVATLREEGLGTAHVVARSGGLAVRVGEPLALRPAVQLAERLRALGHKVRIAATPDAAVTYVIRHGNFAAREDAEATGAELMRLGLAHEIVRVR